MKPPGAGLDTRRHAVGEAMDEREERMKPFARVAVALAAMAPLAGQGDEPCKPEARKRLPAAAELAQLCPKHSIFGKAPAEKGDPRGGCTLYFKEGAGFVQVAAAKQEPRIAGGPRAGAEKAAETLGKMGGGKAPAVKRMPWKSVEAWALEKTPGYFVDSGGDVLVVHVTAVVAKPPSDECLEAIVGAVARRVAGR